MPLNAVSARVPHDLLSWLAEPGMLTARVRALCGPAMGFRRLGRLRESALSTPLRERLKVADDICLLREIEFCASGERIVFAQTVLPASTVERYPWLRELGDTPLGEALDRSMHRSSGSRLNMLNFLRVTRLPRLRVAAMDMNRCGPGAPCTVSTGCRSSCRRSSCPSC
jgi:chorismate-pyruvate lyase